METVEFQSYVFLFTVYGGILIGVLYDIYRVLRGTKRSDKLITSIWDIIFIISALLVIIWAVFSSNYGDLRFYVFLGFAVGFLLYDKILSRLLIAVLIFVKKSLEHFIRTTNSILVLPFKALYNLIYYPSKKLFKYAIVKKNRLSKIKRIPRIIISDSKKYIRLIIRRQSKKK